MLGDESADEDTAVMLYPKEKVYFQKAFLGLQVAAATGRRRRRLVVPWDIAPEICPPLDPESRQCRASGRGRGSLPSLPAERNGMLG